MTDATAIYTADQLAAMSYAMVQTQAKNVGHKYIGIKKVALIEELLKHYELLLAEETPVVEEPTIIEVEEQEYIEEVLEDKVQELLPVVETEAKPSTASPRKGLSSDDKLAKIINIVETVDKVGLVEAMKALDKSRTYVARTYRAYTEIYQQSATIRDLFESGLIGWGAIHKLAEKDPKKVGLETMEAAISI